MTKKCKTKWQKNDNEMQNQMTKKWQRKTEMTNKCKTKWQKNARKTTKINIQQPSEFAGKIFIRLQASTSMRIEVESLKTSQNNLAVVSSWLSYINHHSISNTLQSSQLQGVHNIFWGPTSPRRVWWGTWHPSVGAGLRSCVPNPPSGWSSAGDPFQHWKVPQKHPKAWTKLELFMRLPERRQDNVMKRRRKVDQNLPTWVTVLYPHATKMKQRKMEHVGTSGFSYVWAQSNLRASQSYSSRNIERHVWTRTINLQMPSNRGDLKNKIE